MDIPRFYKASALPASPTAADDGVYFVRPNSSVGYICYIITNGVAVQQDAVTTAALLAITGVLSNLTTPAKTNLVDAINEVNGKTSANLSVRQDANIRALRSEFTSYLTGSSGVSNYVHSGASAGLRVERFSGPTSQLGFDFNTTGVQGVVYMRTFAGQSSNYPFEMIATREHVSANYALLSQVYTQAQALGLFVGKTGVETIQDTKTFTHSPIVPNGTLNGHTVNLGQVNNLLLGFLPTGGNGNNLNTNGVGDNNNVVTAVRYTIGTDANPAPTGSTGVLWSAGITSYRAQIHMSFNGGLSVRSMNNGVFGGWREIITDANLDAKSTALGFIKSAAIPAQVNITQGAGVSVTGTYPNLTITNTAPNVQADWNATSGLAQILNKPTIQTPNNGTFTVQGTGALTGSGSTSADASVNTSATLDLTTATKNDITAGKEANTQIQSLFSSVDRYYKLFDMTGGGTVDPSEQVITQIFTRNGTQTINISDHFLEGADLKIYGAAGGITTVNINAVNLVGSTLTTLNLEGNGRSFHWSNDAESWVEYFN